MNGLSKQEYPPWVKFILTVLRGWLFIYDILAYLPFKFLASPVQKLLRSNRVKGRPIKDGDISAPFRSTECPNDELVTEEFPGCDTLDKIFDRAVKVYSGKDCLGYREVISVDLEKQPSGRMFEKYTMGDYSWISYDELSEIVSQIGVGLLKLNQKPYDKVVIFAETRYEWLATALACFRFRFPVVTVYATLGEDAIVKAINETEATTIFTSHELVEKTVKLLPRCSTLRRLIYFESHLPKTKSLEGSQFPSLPSEFDFRGFLDLLDLGDEESQNLPERPVPSDIAVIIYTSGTTGSPKGVILSHENVVAANYGQTAYLRPVLAWPDILIGYLPLAHVLELTLEFGCITHGARVGYSSALTLTDNSSKIKIGAKGDITVLKPTLMPGVPTIMDRIYKAVIDKVEHSTPFSRALFEFLYELKRSKIESGYDTPFLNRFIFKKIRAILGGRVRVLLSGGAPLHPETQRFMNICFCCPVGQGYGLTETSGAGCVGTVDDLSTGRVGPPLRCCDIMLRNWDEGGYKVTNSPYPQGEIYIGGKNVGVGYYKDEKQTAEHFIEIDGRRWFITGDIGEMFWDGTLKIIDRKKDLVKLSHGEYVSLSKVEMALLTNPLVDNLCMYANSFTDYLIGLVVPNEKNLMALAKRIKVTCGSFDEARTNNDVLNAFLRELQEYAKQNRLEKSELPGKIHLCKEVWTIDNGLLTDAMKIKRKPLENFYKDVIARLYGGINGHNT